MEESPEQKYLWLKRSQSWVLYWLNRLPTALEVLFLVAIIRLLENTPVGRTFITWLGIQSFLEIIESVSILVAVFIYFKEGPERQKRSRYEAWKVIDAAHGRRNSYARIQALQDLNEEGISLRGLDAPKADLREINLRKAMLLNANLQKADLLEANLQKADLRAANLCRANLQRANLQKADLRAANLVEANLLGADLENVNLKAADLKDAKLRAANLKGANLLGANLQGTDLRIAEHLTPEQVKAARHWTEALYDPEFMNQLGLEPRPDVPPTELFFNG
ncbi:pentapeptide repeat-containing protein [Oscillatoria sp. FACHB-1407]|uniref:pentapeptide repeat-containing protein n=1 Tax=Oscillatoria sp. FACHB-1407 TaxID=2692847 RepID=UPI001688F62D|nr:pentapeptide repeat-containing protein [Oscillatoria sp. FACHB-1407]MBD2462100.1 pentapeptide repeat-containing protein [Oscillatoria sp. FACHB-1407]